MVESHDIGSVQEGQPQILGHEPRGEVLAAAHELRLGVRAGAGFLSKSGELIADGIGKPQLISDIEVTLADICEQLVTGHAVIDMCAHQKQQVGHLGVAFEAAT